jgi:hypothetical protein
MTKKHPIFKRKKRVVLFALATYLLSSIVSMFVALLMGTNLTSFDRIPDHIWYASALATIPIIALLTWRYLRKNKPSLSHGFHFGVALVLLGFLLDIALVIPTLNITEAPLSALEYYAHPPYWIALASMVTTTSIVGMLMQPSKQKGT